MLDDNKEKKVLDDRDEDVVWYCQTCLSLRIENLSEDEMIPFYCGSCGSADVETALIQDWDEMYQRRYKRKFLNK